jgi:hypothetical protein
MGTSKQERRDDEIVEIEGVAKHGGPCDAASFPARIGEFPVAIHGFPCLHTIRVRRPSVRLIFGTLSSRWHQAAIFLRSGELGMSSFYGQHLVEVMNSTVRQRTILVV